MPRQDQRRLYWIAWALAVVTVVLLLGSLAAPASAVPLTVGAALAGLASAVVAATGWRIARREMATVEAERAAAEAERAAAEAERAAAEAERTAADRERDRLRTEVKRADDALAAAVVELTTLREAHAEARAAAEREHAVAESESHARREVEDRLTRRLESKEVDLERLRSDRTTLQRHHLLERHWIAELRTKVLELQREHGTLGDPSSIPDLVLRIAITLLEAEKGLILSRTDEDGDGDLELLAAHGFESDASRSELAQALARRAIEADQVLRDADLPDLIASTATPADREIRSLVAIPIYILDRFNGIVVCANRAGGFAHFDQEVLLALGGQAGALLQNTRLHVALRGSYLATVGVLADAMGAKDGTLRGHGDHVARYAAAVADRIGMSSQQREEVVFGSLLHDIGKIGISERILLKPAALTVEEFAIVKLHPRIGHRLVMAVPALQRIALAVLHHHERFDGQGYPSGLKGERIPQEARLIAVADAFTAMTTDRPYRKRRSVDEALRELERNAGTQFDPEIVRLFVDEVERHPPRDELTGIGTALADPEIGALREGDETLLGAGAYSLVDSLTLLGSTRRLHDELAVEGERAALQSSPFSIVVVEMASMGDLNERNGYAAGDAALQEAARTVERVAAGCGGSAYRLSGRRLAVVAPHVDATTAADLAADLRRELGEVTGARCGAATWRSDDPNGETVLVRALEAARD